VGATTVGALIGGAIDAMTGDDDSSADGAIKGAIVGGLLKVVTPVVVTWAVGWAVLRGVAALKDTVTGEEA
jgi:hypothetical protein